MMMKQLILIVFSAILINDASGINTNSKTVPYLITLEIEKELITTKSILIIVKSKQNMYEKYNYKISELNGKRRKFINQINVSERDTLDVDFTFKDDNGKFSTESEQIILIENVKRIETSFKLGKNVDKSEYLIFFSTKIIRQATQKDSLEFIRLHSNKIGERPHYKIRNKGITEYYGQSGTHHFYGIIYLKRGQPNGYIKYRSGSYCHSTIPEKILGQGDTVKSWIPSYSYGEEFRFERRGKYKYVVQLGLEPYGYGVPVEMINKGITFKRKEYLIELEDEIEIEI